MTNPQTEKHAPVTASYLRQPERRSTHTRRPVNPGDRHLLYFIAKQERLESYFRVCGESSLPQPQLVCNLLSHEFQVVCHISNSAPKQQHGDGVKSPIRDDLQKRIVQKHTVTREAASNHHIAPSSRG